MGDLLNASPSIFEQHDRDEERMDDMQHEIDSMRKTLATLMECVGLLLRAENIRLDRKMKK